MTNILEAEDWIATGPLDFVTVITSIDGRMLTKKITPAGVQDYQNTFKIRSAQHPVNNLAEFVSVLDKIDAYSCVIHGELLPGVDPADHRRIKHEQTEKGFNIAGEPVETTTPPSYGDASHYWLLLDIDGQGEGGFDWLYELGWGVLPLAVTALLPPELHGVQCHWRLSSSAGIKPGVRIRLAYWLDRALSSDEKDAWLGRYKPIIDPSLFRCVQPNYIAAPIFEGVSDPTEKFGFTERTGMVTGFRPVVAVPEITKPEQHQEAPAGDRTEVDEDPYLVAEAEAMLNRVNCDGASPLGGRTEDMIHLLADMSTTEGAIFSDAGIVAMLEEFWPPADDAKPGTLEGMVARLLDPKVHKKPRGCTCIGKPIQYGYNPETPEPEPASKAFGAAFFNKAPGMKQTLQIAGDYLRYAVPASVKAMRDQNLGFFRRAGRIVRPMASQIVIRGGGIVVGDRLTPVGWAELRHELSNCIDYLKPYKEDWVPTNCPQDLAQTMLAMADRLDLYVLNGITTAPTMTLDGKILDRPGYDEETGLLYRPSTRFPAIPQKPTKDQAIAALAKLKHLVRSFPFETDADRSVWLSAVLTGVIRRSLPTAPMHLFNAPVAGSGKGLLTDMAAIISTGRQASAITQSNDAETEKRLVSMLLAGDPVILIDNVTTALLGDFLCAMLTKPMINARKLGVSEAPELATNVLMMATGNNIRTYGDMTRRSIRCTIDPKVEEPGKREFKNDPVADAHHNRAELLVAALTVLRAHIVAGSPMTGVLGSYPDWARIVVGALLWLGEENPIVTQAELADEDPDKAKLGALLKTWHAAYGSTSITLGTAITSTNNPDFPAFFDAARSVAPDTKGAPGQIDRQRLGNYIGAKKGRVVGGLRFERGKLHNGVGTWFVDQV